MNRFKDLGLQKKKINETGLKKQLLDHFSEEP